MDLLNIQDGTAASRPSLISSLWSLQVQLQNEPGTMNEDLQLDSAGSKKSLPELMMNSGEIGAEKMEFNYCCATDQQQPHTSFRSVKSLSDLNSFSMVPTTSSYQMGGEKEVCKCLEDENSAYSDVGSLFSSRLKSCSMEQEQQQHHAMTGMTRQQKNNNICQWLQKLDLNNASTTGSRDVLSIENNQKNSLNPDFFNK